jgi:hypothetical protein
MHDAPTRLHGCISIRDRIEQEVVLALIDSRVHRASMTTSVLRRISRRAAAARAPQVQQGAVISIRLAGRGEQAALARLAALAERPVPTGRALVAEVDGELRAALSLPCGALIADPFRPSRELRQLLALRAEQLDAEG